VELHLCQLPEVVHSEGGDASSSSSWFSCAGCATQRGDDLLSQVRSLSRSLPRPPTFPFVYQSQLAAIL